MTKRKAENSEEDSKSWVDEFWDYKESENEETGIDSPGQEQVKENLAFFCKNGNFKKAKELLKTQNQNEPNEVG